MSTDGQGRNIAENLNRLSTAHEHYRRAIAYSERELTFTFAKNDNHCGLNRKTKSTSLDHEHTVKQDLNTLNIS